MNRGGTMPYRNPQYQKAVNALKKFAEENQKTKLGRSETDEVIMSALSLSSIGEVRELLTGVSEEKPRATILEFAGLKLC